MGKSIKETMQEFTVNQALKYLEGNPKENIPKLMAWVDKLMPKDWYVNQRNAIRGAIEQKNNWYQLILRLFQQGQRFLLGLSGNVNAADGHALCIGHVFGLDGRSGGKRALRRGAFRRRGVPGGVDRPDDNADGDQDDQHSGNANGDEFLLFG